MPDSSPMNTLTGTDYAVSWTTEGTSGEQTVTEAEWLAPTDDTIKISRKLDFLIGKASDRKFNLFRFACCRQIWHLLVHDLYRQVIESAENLIEGRSTREELETVLLLAENMISTVRASGSPRSGRVLEIRAATAAVHAAKADYAYFSFPNTASYAHCIVQEVTAAACWAGASNACWSNETSTLSPEWSGVYTKVQRAEITLQGHLLLDVFGSPFRPVAISPTVRAWNEALVVRLAQSAYDERQMPAGTLDNSRLAILADALEEAGCTDGDILNHLRGPGPHVRGCWPVDLCLGKS